MASLPQRHAAAPALSLRFSGESWVQVAAPDGRSIEEALLEAGDTRSYAAGEVGHLVLGNASAVELRSSGDVQDLEPYMRANVARFTVSSGGSLAPVSNYPASGSTECLHLGHGACTPPRPHTP